MILYKRVTVFLLLTVFYSCSNSHPPKADSKDNTTAAPDESITLKDSLTKLETILKSDSSNIEAWYNKGLVQAQLNDTLGGINSLEKSYYLQPFQNSGLALANLYAETGDERSLAICNAMLKKDSAHTLTDAVFIKGIYYAKIENDKSAIEQFDECIKMDWKFIEAYMEKGILFYNRKKFPEALKMFQLAATVTNTYADAYFWIGRSFEALSEPSKAMENYYKALALDNDFTEAKEALNRINTP